MYMRQTWLFGLYVKQVVVVMIIVDNLISVLLLKQKVRVRARGKEQNVLNMINSMDISMNTSMLCMVLVCHLFAIFHAHFDPLS